MKYPLRADRATAATRQQEAPHPQAQWIVCAFVLVLASVLLFVHLGHYALWGDEALMALPAEQIIQTGDDSAVMDHNIVGFENGKHLRHLHDCYTPPLYTYLSAASMAVFGTNAYAFRLPSALAGLGCIALVLLWAMKERVSLTTLCLLGGTILGNVSFMLFARQGRYFGIVMLLSVAIAYLYIRWRGKRSELVALSVLMGLLFAAHCMAFAAIAFALVVDFAIWRRKEVTFKGIDWACLIIPMLAIMLPIGTVWNPLIAPVGADVFKNDSVDHIVLFIRNVLDINTGELVVGILAVAAPFIAILKEDWWVIRIIIAMGAFILIVSIVTPQVVCITTMADVRYLTPLIPAGWFIAVRTIQHLSRKSILIAVILAVSAFGSNLLHGGAFFPWELRSTLFQYARELVTPPSDPYTVAAQWIRASLKEGDTIAVVPDQMCYSLMFHAPAPTYAWHFDMPPRKDLAQLPAIYFKGQAWPDYLLVFGPEISGVREFLQQLQSKGIGYKPAGTINFFWKDLHRPEMFWRTFVPLTKFSLENEAIYIFKKSDPGADKSAAMKPLP